MKFTLHRNHTLRTTLGHCITFQKGVPTHVPEKLHKEVIAIGGVPEDPAFLQRLEDSEEIVRKDPVMNPDMRQKTIRDALMTMKERNLRGYFTAQGVPSLKQLEMLCGFEVDKLERDRLWASMMSEEPAADDAQAAA
jgi:hypothetical protein